MFFVGKVQLPKKKREDITHAREKWTKNIKKKKPFCLEVEDFGFPKKLELKLVNWIAGVISLHPEIPRGSRSSW